MFCLGFLGPTVTAARSAITSLKKLALLGVEQLHKMGGGDCWTENGLLTFDASGTCELGILENQLNIGFFDVNH